MKKIIYSLLLAVLFISTTNAQIGSERSGYEGDYFNLEGTLEVFKNSNSIKQFERRINSEDSWVNNLDLNYDGQIDYIRVEHKRNRNFHAIILQAVMSRYEVQDVAVIEIEKRGRHDVVLQIIGDEDLYGDMVIIEPYDNSYNAMASNDYYYYDNDSYDRYHNVYINVYNWSPIRHIFHRSYNVYVSPYNWRYTPRWWSPWRQHGWNHYYKHRNRHHNYYHRSHHHRVVNAHRFYKPSRSHSKNVRTRTNKVRKQGKVYGHGSKSNINRGNKKRKNDILSPSKNNRKMDNNISRDKRNGQYNNTKRPSNNALKNSLSSRSNRTSDTSYGRKDTRKVGRSTPSSTKSKSVRKDNNSSSKRSYNQSTRSSNVKRKTDRTKRGKSTKANTSRKNKTQKSSSSKKGKSSSRRA